MLKLLPCIAFQFVQHAFKFQNVEKFSKKRREILQPFRTVKDIVILFSLVLIQFLEEQLKRFVYTVQSCCPDFTYSSEANKSYSVC